MSGLSTLRTKDSAWRATLQEVSGTPPPPGPPRTGSTRKTMCDNEYRSPASEVADVAESLADRLMDLANVAHGVGVGLRDLAARLRETPTTPPEPADAEEEEEEEEGGRTVVVRR